MNSTFGPTGGRLSVRCFWQPAVTAGPALPPAGTELPSLL